MTGVAIGSGWQALVAYINLGCYYIFGVPLGCLLCFNAKLGEGALGRHDMWNGFADFDSVGHSLQNQLEQGGN